jgi:5-deoxy-D-glucuronate isomerase
MKVGLLGAGRIGALHSGLLAGDTVLVPQDYHAGSAPPGYDLYYLNVMAGPVREWKVKNDPAHEWLLE